jgi:precorrin-6B methylase 2
MAVQARAKDAVKPMLFADEHRLRTVRFGPGRGVRLHLNRRQDLQREFGVYESELSRAYRRLIARDALIYDIGANDGFTTLIFAQLAPDGHVYAFEPKPHGLVELERNLNANPALASRVTVAPVAVGGASSSTSVDAFVAQNRPPAFVKIDVDGSELDVLEGMSETLQAHAPALIVEVHSRELERRCVTLLRDAGYSPQAKDHAWWRTLYPEMRPIDHNRWLIAQPSRLGTVCSLT